MRTTAITALATILLSFPSLCGGSSTPAPNTTPPIVVKISAASPSTYTTGTDQFKATVTGTTNTAVSWKIEEGAIGGTISATGLYKAPAKAGIFHVIATSEADESSTANMPITVVPVTVKISAASNPTYPTGTDQFKATVTGTTNTAVSWRIWEGAIGGTISATGLYTAPSTTGAFHVIATSKADPADSTQLHNLG